MTTPFALFFAGLSAKQAATIHEWLDGATDATSDLLDELVVLHGDTMRVSGYLASNTHELTECIRSEGFALKAATIIALSDERCMEARVAFIDAQADFPRPKDARQAVADMFKINYSDMPGVLARGRMLASSAERKAENARKPKPTVWNGGVTAAPVTNEGEG